MLWYRAMRGKEARKKCPELQLVQVPLMHGKAELGPYRAAGKQVACPTSIQRTLACLGRRLNDS